MTLNFCIKTKPYLFILIASTFLIDAYAADIDESEKSYQYDTVVVTATRTSRTVNDSVSSVKVITREEIVNSQAQSIPDLLQGMVGVHFAQNGGRGSNSSLFLRGTNSDHVIVLIDGVKVGSATSGTVAFQNLPMEQIERIEVVRGPRSSLYGSEALGGVIQIFTKKGGGNTSLSSHVTVGSHDTYETSVGIAGGGENVFYNLSVEGEKTQGIDSCRAEAATQFGGCFADQPDKDGYKNVAGSVRLGYKTDFGSEFSVFSLQTNAESDFDGNYQDNSESEQRVLGFKSVLQMTKDLDLSLSYSQTEDNSDSYIGGIYSSTFDTTRDNASLQSNIILFDRDVFTLGTDYQKDKVSSSENFTVTERETYGIFSQYLLSYQKHDIELSARYDYNEGVKDAFTGSVGYAYQLENNLRFFMSYGTAFKTPSFNELYYPFFGVPTLKPEESDTFEIGVRSENQPTNWALTYFSTKIEELIAYNSATLSVLNIDIASIQGVELETVSKLSQNWLFGTDLNIISPRNKSEGSYQGNLLARRPKISSRITLDYVTDTWTAGASLMHVGMRYDDVANNNKLDSYQTLDLKAQYQLSEELLVQGRVENVFDSSYETAQFYNQLDRSFYLTLRYAMN
tara:strand:- start:9222 stop:11096 length:1875 start_codon:yes stop_codon:yes gene_type:complete